MSGYTWLPAGTVIRRNGEYEALEQEMPFRPLTPAGRAGVLIRPSGAEMRVTVLKGKR